MKGTCIDGDRLVIGGINVWDEKWKPTGKKAAVKDPIYKKHFLFPVFHIEREGKIIEFAAGEFSNCMWGFFTRKDLSDARSKADWLEGLSKKFHVKSDQHTILLFEATRLRVFIKEAELGRVVPDHLKETALLGKWGESFFSSKWKDIQDSIREIYEQVKLHKSKEDSIDKG